MKVKVYRDKQGAIINVGEWDFMTEEIKGEKKKVIHNPLPVGAVKGFAEMEKDASGGWREIK